MYFFSLTHISVGINYRCCNGPTQIRCFFCSLKKVTLVWCYSGADFSCLCGCSGRLRLINEQDGRCIKLWPSMHWEDFCERRVELRGWTPYVRSVCQVGDRTSPVTGYMSKNKNYSSRLKRRRCSHPSQIVCEYEPQNVAAESWSRARAAGGPTLAGCLYPAVFMVGGFFTWLTFNCMRSNISSSKRGIKMDS